MLDSWDRTSRTHAPTGRGTAKSLAAQRDQRDSCAHPRRALTPAPLKGLTSSWIAGVDLPSRTISPSARAIATAPYQRPCSTPRGTTVHTLRHARQRYRRTAITVNSALPPNARGPSTCRSRTPWPTTTIRLPTGVLAAPHAGQQAGRSSEQDGFAASSCFTDSSHCTNLERLRVSNVHGARRRAARQSFARRHLFQGREIRLLPPEPT